MKSENAESSTPLKVNFILMARFHGHVEEANLRGALERLKGRHPVFDQPDNYGVQSKSVSDTGPYLLDVFTGCSSEDWQAAAARELACPFDPAGPRVRFVLLKHLQADDLLIICDHDGTDGISATFILEDLLELLNHPEGNLPPLPLPPPVWEILPAEVTQSLSGGITSTIIKIVLSLMKWKLKRQKSLHLPPSFQVISKEFSGEWTRTLIQRCRKEDVSVHAAFCAAWLSALNPQEVKKSSQRSVSSPVSLRKFLPSEMLSCAGMYYTTVVTSLKWDITKNFWDRAREIKQLMLSAEKKPDFYNTALILKNLADMKSHLQDGESPQMPEPAITYDYSISNLGRVQSKYVFSESNMDPYSIEALYGPIVNAFKGEKTLGVCTLGERLRLAFTTFPDEMDLESANNLLERAVKLLQVSVQ